MKVLLVEDDQMHLSYLRELVVDSLPDVTKVLVANHGRNGEIIARNNRVPAVVMDLRMKEHNGIEAARTIWSERPNTKILFWSNYSDEAYLRGIASIVPPQAAYGYILKTASIERMQLALRAVFMESQVIVDREIHQIQHQQNRSTETLTEVEHVILMDVALGLPDKLISKRRKLSLRTVQNRLLSLYDKLNVSTIENPEYEVKLNKRVRAVSNAISKSIINREGIEIAERKLQKWFEKINNT